MDDESPPLLLRRRQAQRRLGQADKKHAKYSPGGFFLSNFIRLVCTVDPVPGRFDRAIHSYLDNQTSSFRGNSVPTVHCTYKR